MAVEGSLLFGFTLAASRLIDAVDGDVWMVARGIPALEFVSPIDERFAWLARGAPGVAATGRGIAGWAPFQRNDGDRTFVFAVGVTDRFLGKIPSPDEASNLVGGRRIPLQVDETDQEALSDTALPVSIQVAGTRADLVGSVKGFAAFLGTPFVFARFEDMRNFLPYAPSTVSFILVRAERRFTPEAVRNALRARFNSVDIWTTREFSWRARIFWLIKTGAGGALSLAAILGFLIGLSVVAQTIYSLTAENVEEYATLRALGASKRYVKSIVLIQSLSCGAIGTFFGLIALGPFANAAKAIVTWIFVPGWMYPLVTAVVTLLCLLAASIASRPAINTEPARVFRA
jgi:putative ABC transport system permease protein